MYINHDPVVTLTQFMARLTRVAYAFEWVKLLKCHSRKLANEQNIDYSEQRKWPKAALGLNTIIFKHVYWYMQQISGERLQDHWSSGFMMLNSAEHEISIAH